jgi:hypothetical protein
MSTSRARPSSFDRTRCSLSLAFGVLLVAVGPALAQSNAPTPGRPLESLVDLPTVPIEQMADVIVIARPHADMPPHVAAPAERVIQGVIERVDKGKPPQTTIHTAKTIIAPLRAGIPVKLYLKAFPDRNAHYIIGVFPPS